jgi:MFS family permease
MWALGVVAYIVAVFHRGSLSVAGLEAEHRFGIGAATLSLFGVVQLAVYAAMQVPVGALLDRWGSRRMLLGGAALMAAGQVSMAVAHTVPLAVLARVLVGAGDAMTFISVLRLVVAWIPAPSVPVVTQVTGILGQLGQVAAAYPMVALLHSAGWSATFAGAAVLSIVVAVVVGAVLRDAPPGTPPVRHAGWQQVSRTVQAAWAEPGTRLGMWTHFVTQFSGTVFALLWGYPFLVAGEGLRPSTAGLLLTVLVVVGMVVAPVLGRLAGRWPLRRSLLVFAIVGASATAWTAVLAWPGRAPLWLLVLLCAVLASNGPGSMIGFDYARTENPPSRLGSASGIVNVGGFVASLVTILLIGLLLQGLTDGPSTKASLGAFKVAFSVQYVFWAIGLVNVVRTRGVLRRRLAAAGRPLDPVHRAALRRWRAR